VNDGGGFYHININSALAGGLVGHTANYNAIGWKNIVADGASGLAGRVYVAVVGMVAGRFYQVHYMIVKVKWVNKFPSLDEVVA
jgi:hypothetical protein